MALVLAPYNNAMRLGMGFNSYTQKLCINDAVQKPGGLRATDADLRNHSDSSTLLDGKQPHPNFAAGLLSNPPGTLVRHTHDGQKAISQTIKWEATFVEKLSDVTRRMDISGGHIIKLDALGAGTKAQGYFIDEAVFKSSDINYLIHVEVTNQRLVAEDVTQFVPLRSVTPSRFTDVYGDSFISGFLEGGCFNALVSIKLSDDSEALQALAHAFGGTLPMTELAQVTGSMVGSGTAIDLTHNHKTAITVSWSGGGQVKPSGVKEWTIDTLREAAMGFPDAVALCPQRTSAILTKYTALRSFHEQVQRGIPLTYENAGIYTHTLLDAYTDYKAIVAQAKTLSLDIEQGNKVAIARQKTPELIELSQTLKKAYDARKSALAVRRPLYAMNQVTLTNGSSDPPITAFEDSLPPLDLIPYAATVFGLEKLQRDAQGEMVKIAKEVDKITAYPQIASDPERYREYLSPTIFKLLIPTVTPIGKGVDNQAIQDVIKKLKEDAVVEQTKFNAETKSQQAEISQLKKDLEKAKESVGSVSLLTAEVARLQKELERAKESNSNQEDVALLQSDLKKAKEKIDELQRILEDAKLPPYQRKATKLDYQIVRAIFGEDDVTRQMQEMLSVWKAGQGDAKLFSFTPTDQIFGTKPAVGDTKKHFDLAVSVARDTDASPLILNIPQKTAGDMLSLRFLALSLFPHPDITLSDPSATTIVQQLDKGLNLRMTPSVGASTVRQLNDFSAVTTLDETWELASLSFYLHVSKGAFAGIECAYTNGKTIKAGTCKAGDASRLQVLTLGVGERITAAEIRGGKIGRYVEGSARGLYAVFLSTSLARSFGLDLYAAQAALAPDPDRQVWSSGAPLPGYALKGFWGGHGEIIDRAGLVWGWTAPSPPSPSPPPPLPPPLVVGEITPEAFCAEYANLNPTWQALARAHISDKFRLSGIVGSPSAAEVRHPFATLKKEGVGKPVEVAFALGAVDLYRCRVDYADGSSTGALGDRDSPELAEVKFRGAAVGEAVAVEVEGVVSEVAAVHLVPARVTLYGKDGSLICEFVCRDLGKAQALGQGGKPRVFKLEAPGEGWYFKGFCVQSAKPIVCLAVVWGRR